VEIAQSSTGIRRLIESIRIPRDVAGIDATLDDARAPKRLRPRRSPSTSKYQTVRVRRPVGGSHDMVRHASIDRAAGHTNGHNPPTLRHEVRARNRAAFGHPSRVQGGANVGKLRARACQLHYPRVTWRMRAPVRQSPRAANCSARSRLSAWPRRHAAASPARPSIRSICPSSAS
jgi:hypothetical protein